MKLNFQKIPVDPSEGRNLKSSLLNKTVSSSSLNSSPATKTTSKRDKSKIITGKISLLSLLVLLILLLGSLYSHISPNRLDLPQSTQEVRQTMSVNVSKVERETELSCRRNQRKVTNYFALIPANMKILCSILANNFCTSYTIAQHLERVVVIAPIYAASQPIQRHMYFLHDNFINYIASFGLTPVVIEGVIKGKNQTFLVTGNGSDRISQAHPNTIEIQLELENNGLYYRENLLNVAARKTLELWDYMLWIDGHQWFSNSYWWEETVYKLEHNPNGLSQLFQINDYFNLGNSSIYSRLISQLYALNFEKYQVEGNLHYVSGNAWGIRRDIFINLFDQHIIDSCVAGACDVMLGLLFYEDILKDTPNFTRELEYYNKFWPRILKLHESLKYPRVDRNSYVTGALVHFEHLRYFSYGQTQVSVGHYFDYERDLVRDENFTLHLVNKELRKYFPS